MKIFTTLTVILITLILFMRFDTVYAATTEAKLKVLPMDCIFNFIDDGGSGIIIYITPAECGVDIPSQEPGNSPSPPLAPTENAKNYLRLIGVDFTDEEVTLIELNPKDESSPSSIRFVIDDQAPKSLEKNNSATLSLLRVIGVVSLILLIAYVTRNVLSYNKN